MIEHVGSLFIISFAKTMQPKAAENTLTRLFSSLGDRSSVVFSKVDETTFFDPPFYWLKLVLILLISL